ncbi:coiled-coil domain-containing protein 178 [Sciurus carolinensis]|uniref:coiled-coil domain-containing protein 178 n=1 Tax=Sciurus carolinensis TaxID=30640 RepID=UPI001FB237DA|nr:coiled-coil domain-containing protein 178 [Sciurus carolinensis]
MPGLESLRHIGLSGFYDEYSLNAIVRASITLQVNKGIYFNFPCRRQSCANVNIPAPCVNKMISHIEEVESKIQEHLKQFETSFEEWSITSSTKDWSIAAPVEEVKPEERDEKCSELKKEMQTLLSEAIHLIKCLETDRAIAEETLNQQKLRKGRITTKIDAWSIWKLQELPIAVQKEHDAYLRDIIELQWHLESRTHQLEHVEKQKTKLEEANAKIQTDMDYMLQHGPLLQSKRRQELQVIKERYQKKAEVVEQYRQVHEQLEELKDAFENSKLRVKEAKERMDKDISLDEASIEKYKRELDRLNNLFNRYSLSIKSASAHIEEKQEAMSEALKETESSSSELSALSKTLARLKKLYDEQCLKKSNYQQHYLEVLNKFYVTKSSWDTELSNVAKDFSDVSIAHTQGTEENERLLLDLENMTKEINDSVKRKNDYESEIQSLLKTRAKNEEFIKYLYKDAYHVGAHFHLAKYKIEELEDKIAEVKRKYKNREDFLKRRIRSQIAAGMMIQKKIYSVQDDQMNEKKELLRQKAVYALALQEIQEPLLRLESDAVHLETLHQEQYNLLNDIIERREFVRKKVEKTKKKLRRKGKKAREALIETGEKRSAVFQELESTKGKTYAFNVKISELKIELKEQEDENVAFEKKIEQLKENFLVVRFKRENAQSIFDHFMDKKKDCEERIFEEDQKFTMLFNTRQKTLKDIKELQDNSLKENLRLAQEYQKLLETFLKEKDKYFSMYSRQLSVDASVSDKKQSRGFLPRKLPSSLAIILDKLSNFQLCQLQRKLHKRWQEYFRLVVLFHQMQLDKFQAESQESIQKILAVQALQMPFRLF